MTSQELLRHQLITNCMTQHAELSADGAIDLWAQMASQITLIVGQNGFDSLYARSVFLCQPRFPWLAPNAPPPQGNHQFAELKKRFEGQPPDQINAANCLLLITFTDVLAGMIGEQLTVRILNSAWGITAQKHANKELKNE